MDALVNWWAKYILTNSSFIHEKSKGHKYLKKNEISGHDYGILGDKVVPLVNKMEGNPIIDCGSKQTNKTMQAQ